MTEKDKQLIDHARKMLAIDWMIIDRMVDYADTDEAKESLRSLARRKYHIEEFYANNL
jgi:hypothetical protein